MKVVEGKEEGRLTSHGSGRPSSNKHSVMVMRIGTNEVLSVPPPGAY